MEENINKKESIILMLNEAVNSILGLWCDNSKSFWRSTSHKKRAPDLNEFTPTATFRCIESLVSTMIEYQDLITKSNVEIIKKIIIEFLKFDVTNLKSSIDDLGSTKVNDFTLAIGIQALSRIVAFMDTNDSNYKIANDKLNFLAKELFTRDIFKDSNGEKAIQEHPFYLFHFIRAYILCKKFISPEIDTEIGDLKDRIINTIRSISEKQLAKYQLGVMNPSDTVALSFCAAAISHDNQVENFQYLTSAVKIIIAAQDNNGCWPMGRIIHKNKDIENPKLEISTYEISWAIASIALEISVNNKRFYNGVLTKEILQSLYKSLSYTEKSLVHIPESGIINITGWCSSQPYDIEIIESWTTANVLLFLSKFLRLIEYLDELEVRDTFPILSSGDRDWPTWLKWETYKQESEISEEFPILTYLDSKIVQPIKNHKSKLPSPEDRTVSFLLFGPPGTSKTTIAKAIAEGLNWPIIMLNPGQFIEGGLESIERLSQSVFLRLSKISKVVVLFDECDELFRERTPKQGTDQHRSITAFVTACMLPKLQELHDRGRLIFCICTNNFESIDSAIKRGGRIDHVIGVGPPDNTARHKIIDNSYNKFKAKNNNQDINFWEELKTIIAEKTERYTRTELIRAINVILASSPWASEIEARKRVQEILGGFEESLNITPEEYNKFKEQNKKFSHPLIESK